MPTDALIDQLNEHPPAVIRSLRGRVAGWAPERRELRMEFEIGTDFCHTVDIVQGGFITAMLDASMAHAVLAHESPQGRAGPARPAEAIESPGKAGSTREPQHHVRVSSIDITVSFLRPARAGRFTAVGSIVKSGRTIAFLKAELYNDKGDLVATATSSAHLTREHR